MIELYHGSNVVVEKPIILSNGFNKDFGFGFYCTAYEKQAAKWALSKNGKHIVSCFEYSTETMNLSVNSFKEMTDEWLDFVANCRKGLPHKYDIVEGPMANDTIWNYVEDFVDGRISRAAFWELAKFKYPTHQIVFCTERALQQLNYLRFYEL